MRLRLTRLIVGLGLFSGIAVMAPVWLHQSPTLDPSTWEPPCEGWPVKIDQPGPVFEACGPASAALADDGAPPIPDEPVSWMTRLAGVPRLECGSHPEAYRFAWLRTFDAPIIVTVVLGVPEPFVETVWLTGQSGFEPGEVDRRARRTLTLAEIAQARRRVRQAGFWQTQERCDMKGLDGAAWVLEGRRGDQYQLVSEWSPTEGAIRAAGLDLLAMGGVDLQAEPVY